MEVFVLIYVIVTGYGAGSGAAEFVGKDACEQAGAAAKEELGGLLREFSFVCVPKHGER